MPQHDSAQVNTCHPAPLYSCPQNECTTVCCQYTDISLPIELKPTTCIGTIEIECCGKPDIVCKEATCCKNTEVIITQNICIKIPVTYKVTTCVGESSMNCCSDSPISK